MARAGTTDRWAAGRLAGAQDAARAMSVTEWFRVPLPLPLNLAERRKFLAGYAAGLEDGLSS
jgi:hypothetical protein